MDLGSSDLVPEGAPEHSGFEPDDGNEPGFTFTDKLPLMTDAESVTAESIRALRAFLVAQHLQDGRRSLAICAPSSGAGCSFLAANLAVGIAQSGISTLLIDANLRDPSIDDYIRPSRQVIGLSECLREDTLSMGGVVCGVQPNLSVLYSGHIDDIARNEIGGHVFKSLLNSCLRDYDFTIIDTPAANRYADAHQIAAAAHYALVVACRERTYVKDVRTLLDQLALARTTVLGTYLNDY